MIVVLRGSTSSFITRLHFEFSNYTQAEYFTEINLLPALRTDPPPFPSYSMFHIDNNFDCVCVCMCTSCMLPQQEEDKCSFCVLLGWTAYQMCRYAQWKTKKYLMAFCKPWLPHWRNAAAVGYFKQPKQHLETEGLLSSHNSSQLFTDAIAMQCYPQWYNRRVSVESFALIIFHLLCCSCSLIVLFVLYDMPSI